MMNSQIHETDDKHQMISHEELRARLRDRGLVIVDVMPRETYAEGHIPRSINLSVAEIENKARQLIPNLAEEIAIYCAGPN